MGNRDGLNCFPEAHRICNQSSSTMMHDVLNTSLLERPQLLEHVVLRDNPLCQATVFVCSMRLILSFQASVAPKKEVWNGSNLNPNVNIAYMI